MDMNSTASVTSAVSEVLKRVCAERPEPELVKLSDMLCTATPKEVADYGFSVVKNRDLDPNVRATIWWASQAPKKHRGSGTYDADRLSSEATTAFLQRNSAVKGQRLWWPLVDSVRKHLRDALPEPPIDEGRARFGPGAVAEGLDGVQRWTLLEDCDFDPRNPAIIPHYEEYGKLSLHQPRLSAYDQEHDSTARLVAVPKDAWRMRLISVEPARNSFLQQFVRSLIISSVHDGVLRNTPSDFESYRDNVEIQQRRCILSSERLHTSTIDLKDASDWISAEDVFCLFPPWLLPWLEMSRTPYVRDRFGNVHELWMYGGMGNATTFLVESLYFWAVFEAIGDYLRTPAWATVFGDDIILNTALAQHPCFERLVEHAHITINRDKSCYEPGVRLREACGMVSYDGIPLPRLVRLQAPGRGRVADCLIGDIANRLELSPLRVCRAFAGVIHDSYELPTVYSYPLSVHNLYGCERTWRNPSIGAFLFEGDPRWSEGHLRRSTYHQAWEVRVPCLIGKERRHFRRWLSGLESLAVIDRQIRTRRMKKGTALLCSLPYHTTTKQRWIGLDG